MGRKATYIRAWRKHRGFTLDQMVGRMAELGVETTGASLSRIERGSQPYSQDILEAIAEALNVSPADLIENNPALPEAEVIDLLRHLDERERVRAADMLKVMFSSQA